VSYMHLFNVTKLHHRDIGLTNIGLLSKFPNLPKYASIKEPTVEIIGDFVHVHPLAVQLALSTKKHDNIAFITDAIIDKQVDKPINYAGRMLEISNDKTKVLLKGTNTLAGSCINLLDVFYNLINVLNVPIPEASMMLSEVPCRIAKLKHIGKLAVGKRADMILFSGDLKLQKVLINGALASETDSAKL